MTVDLSCTRLIAIVGPTATGKTPLAVALAGRLGGAEMINADSRQVIRGLRVGTCAPTVAQLGGLTCHGLDLRDPGEHFTAASWVHAVAPELDRIDRSGGFALLVGGTGLYIEAALDGLVFAGGAPDPGVRLERDALALSPSGHATLVAELIARDPAGAATVDLRNPRRVVRALELVDALGSLHAARHRGPGRPALRIGLDAPRPLHHRLIEERSAGMIRSGALLAEVESARRGGVSRTALERSGIGYGEALALLDGRASMDQAVEALARRTRRYAKAQRTWFRRDQRIRWLERGEDPVEGLVDEVVDALHQDARTGE